MDAMKVMRDQHFSHRGYGEFLQSLSNMCHYLMRKGFGTIFNPWELTISKLIIFYKYQKVQDYSAMLEDIIVQKRVAEYAHYGEDGRKALEQLERFLKRPDHI